MFSTTKNLPDFSHFIPSRPCVEMTAPHGVDIVARVLDVGWAGFGHWPGLDFGEENIQVVKKKLWLDVIIFYILMYYKDYTCIIMLTSN